MKNFKRIRILKFFGAIPANLLRNNLLGRSLSNQKKTRNLMIPNNKSRTISRLLRDVDPLLRQKAKLKKSSVSHFINFVPKNPAQNHKMKVVAYIGSRRQE